MNESDGPFRFGYLRRHDMGTTYFGRAASVVLDLASRSPNRRPPASCQLAPNSRILGFNCSAQYCLGRCGFAQLICGERSRTEMCGSLSYRGCCWTTEGRRSSGISTSSSCIWLSYPSLPLPSALLSRSHHVLGYAVSNRHGTPANTPPWTSCVRVPIVLRDIQPASSLPSQVHQSRSPIDARSSLSHRVSSLSQSASSLAQVMSCEASRNSQMSDKIKTLAPCPLDRFRSRVFLLL